MTLRTRLLIDHLTANGDNWLVASKMTTQDKTTRVYHKIARYFIFEYGLHDLVWIIIIDASLQWKIRVSHLNYDLIYSKVYHSLMWFGGLNKLESGRSQLTMSDHHLSLRKSCSSCMIHSPTDSAPIYRWSYLKCFKDCQGAQVKPSETRWLTPSLVASFAASYF